MEAEESKGYGGFGRHGTAWWTEFYLFIEANNNM
jgi:hypothetical protein